MPLVECALRTMIQGRTKFAVHVICYEVESKRNERSAAVCAGGQKREEASPAYITAKSEEPDSHSSSTPAMFTRSIHVNKH